MNIRKYHMIFRYLKSELHLMHSAKSFYYPEFQLIFSESQWINLNNIRFFLTINWLIWITKHDAVWITCGKGAVLGYVPKEWVTASVIFMPTIPVHCLNSFLLKTLKKILDKESRKKIKRKLDPSSPYFSSLECLLKRRYMHLLKKEWNIIVCTIKW